MSTPTQQQTPAAGLPSPDQAYNTLFDGVHQRAFFAKLAGYGHSPRSAEEAQEYLELAGKLRLADENGFNKAAQQQTQVSPIGQASIALDNLLARRGHDGPIKAAAAQQRHIATVTAAQQLAADPAIYNAALSIKAAEAAQVARQLA